MQACACESPQASTALARPIASRLEVESCQLETRDVEAWRHRAADERPGSEALGALPDAGRHHCLWALTGEEVGPEPQLVAARQASRVGNGQGQRRARMPVPRLSGIDPVPARQLAANKQEIDGGGGRAARGVGGAIAEGLAKVTALGMGAEAEEANDLLGGEARRGHGRARWPSSDWHGDAFARRFTSASPAFAGSGSCSASASPGS